MKLYQKVSYHIRKVEIDFGGYGPNRLRILSQKGPKANIFSGFRTIICV